LQKRKKKKKEKTVLIFYVFTLLFSPFPTLSPSYCPLLAEQSRQWTSAAKSPTLQMLRVSPFMSLFGRSGKKTNKTKTNNEAE